MLLSIASEVNRSSTQSGDMCFHERPELPELQFRSEPLALFANSLLNNERILPVTLHVGLPSRVHGVQQVQAVFLQQPLKFRSLRRINDVAAFTALSLDPASALRYGRPNAA